MNNSKMILGALMICLATGVLVAGVQAQNEMKDMKMTADSRI